MPYKIPMPSHWPITIPDATATTAGVVKLGGAGGGGGLTVVNRNANFAAGLSELENCNTQGGAITATLPAAATASGTTNQVTLINNPPAGGNTLTITPAGGDTISWSAASLALAPGESVQLVSDGASNWMVIV